MALTEHDGSRRVLVWSAWRDTERAEGECLTCGRRPGEGHDPIRCLPEPEEDARDLADAAATDA